MILGDRLRAIRKSKNLSQRDIEERSGLLCCYVSRVENGQTVPAIDTLEKFSRALQVPMYQLFYEGPTPADLPNPRRNANEDWASSGAGRNMFAKLRKAASQLSNEDRQLLLAIAQKVAISRRRKRASEPG
jgi:transcriptional regulator with XRE-family HTH domain